MKKYVYTSIDEFLKENLINDKNELEDMSQDDINEILRGYIETALWTEEERLKENIEDDDEDDDEIEKLIKLKDKIKTKPDLVISDNIDLDSKIEAYNDIKKFIMIAGDDAVEEAIRENGLFRLGMDIWLTRNHHGAGFFDHSYEEENEDALIKAGNDLGSKYLEIGDDNKLHFY